jgi:hypothetical protein
MGGPIRIVALVAGISLTVGVAACGGGGDQLTAEEYAAELNAICADYNVKRAEIGERQSVEDVVDIAQQTLDAFDDAIADVETLEPPNELADPAGDFIASWKDQRDLLPEIVDRAEEGDDAGIDALADQGSELDTQSDELAEEMGATACVEAEPTKQSSGGSG